MIIGIGSTRYATCSRMILLGDNNNQSTDSTGGTIVSECRLENGPERGLETVLFSP